VLKTYPNIPAPDDFYESLMELHRHLNHEESAAANARLVFLLANHIGEADILKEAIRLAAGKSTTATLAERDGYTVSTDSQRLDAAAIHDYLSKDSYWAKGIPAPVLKKALANSMCFGLYKGEQQIGLARVITDRATYCYLCDVYVLEAHRGHGLGKWLIDCVVKHPDLQGLRRKSLVTSDAHELYAQFGYTALSKPERHMEMVDPDVYSQSTAQV
jgi:GNAT superfamily N-acetyltransferase